MLELYATCNAAKAVVKGILFAVFEDSLITVEVERRDPDWSKVEDGKPVFFPTLAHKGRSVALAYLSHGHVLCSMTRVDFVAYRTLSFPTMVWGRPAPLTLIMSMMDDGLWSDCLPQHICVHHTLSKKSTKPGILGAKKNIVSLVTVLFWNCKVILLLTTGRTKTQTQKL